MRKIVSVCAVLALVACAQPAEDEATDEIADEAMAEETASIAGTYEGTTDEGEEWTGIINEDGTTEIVMGGEVVDSGTWRTDEAGATCFTMQPQEGEEEATENCYTFSEPGEDGSVVVTNAEGEENTMMKVS
ncbi:hypothetical protein [Aurantiacibacter sp. D1-12]|uniref:hypothetical protein n=1 Tax=Aurantiacibacter sp. D1-12 TaxID=2993658 RepID=UPI00237CE643|nr:hypothetical protein [Aurantiacibacter sp. D1-12]MDE1466606.1 hypothetical protein [Aurantiacibacter sp. D1-12]